MAEAKSLLIELGAEELPPKALDALAHAFAKGICDGLEKHGIAADLAHARTFCSPRRLAVHVPAVVATQPEQAIERRGPAVQAGMDNDGKHTRALTGFAGSCGVGVDALELLETDKGAWYVYRAVQPGRATAELLPEILTDALKGLPIPRPMRWGDHDYSFVRPVHWLVILHGDQVVPAELMGLSSGRASRGHRFHHPEDVCIADADSWLDSLRQAHVLADPAERERQIDNEIFKACGRIRGRTGNDGLSARMDADNLIEVRNLTEWPVGIECSFDAEFLCVPQEALVTTMQDNQKFFPCFNGDGTLSEHFIGIANIESKEPAEIRKGYERVIRPRFADARFFYTEDLKTPLRDLQQDLHKVTYQESLGSLWDKSGRVAELCRIIANRVGVDAQQATTAASLSKCDLLTRMVGEFPELQGTMGRYYARAHGEPAAVADALDEAYLPRHAGDRIAEGEVARVLAVAERIDTLAGIFAVGLKPTGNKDPFALRRAALGLARTLVEGQLAIDLGGTFREALELIPEAALAAGLAHKAKGKPAPALDAGARRKALLAELTGFVMERLRGYYAEQGFARGVFDAVDAVSPSNLPDFDRRLRAVAAFIERPEAASLAAAHKRVGNLLRKQAQEQAAGLAQSVNPALFESDAEHQLAAALEAAGRDSERAVDQGDYTEALTRLATLHTPVDAFFEQVLVVAEDPAVRGNRLALLAQLRDRFLAVADIGHLQA